MPFRRELSRVNSLLTADPWLLLKHERHSELTFDGASRRSLPGLVETLEGCSARSEPGELRAQRITAFPGARSARVLVVELEDTTGVVRRLQADVERELRLLGHAPEERAFRTHVTLGRVRKGKLDARSALAAASPPAAGWHVEDFALIESRLSPKGPAYVVIRSFRLGAR